MENFNSESQELSLSAGSMQSMMSEAGATASNPDAENLLMKKYAEELQIDVGERLPETTTSQISNDDVREQALNENLRRIRA